MTPYLIPQDNLWALSRASRTQDVEGLLLGRGTRISIGPERASLEGLGFFRSRRGSRATPGPANLAGAGGDLLLLHDVEREETRLWLAGTELPLWPETGDPYLDELSAGTFPKHSMARLRERVLSFVPVLDRAKDGPPSLERARELDVVLRAIFRFLRLAASEGRATVWSDFADVLERVFRPLDEAFWHLVH